ncbi:MAG TPA: Ig-like domain-containing protein, partial [Actinomycetota bacterium]|nr:Ig-like domain-containing protein [Actinomycetota bacterium]
WGPGRLDCTPETDMNPTGTSHQVACTVRDGNNQTASGANVDVEATGANDPDGGNTPQTPDFTCTTDGNGGCSFTHGGTGGGSTAGAGTTTYRAWVDLDGNNATPEADVGENLDEGGNGAGSTNEPDHTDVVQKVWTAGALDCTPETAQNPTGTSHTITCTARDSSGNVVPGPEVDAEVTGANDRDSSGDLTNPDFSCTTSAAGSCTFTHGGGGNNGSSDATGTSTYRSWIDADSSNATAEADATESRDESGAGAGGTTDPDATDVVEKTWVTQPRTISCTPATATNPAGTQHTVTCTVRDRSGQPLAGRAVTLSSTGTGTLSSQSQQTTNNAGQVQATTTSTEEGTQSITATLGDDLQGNEPNDVDECDRAAGDPAGSPAGQCSATVTKTWIAPLAQAANLTVTPAEATNEVGDDHTLTATVTDANGSPMEGAPVTWTSTGVGEIEESDATTDANGVAMAVISSEEAGDQLVSVSTSPCAQGGDCTDTALKHWTTGPCTITGTEAGERLTGTNGDDVICGLGGNDTINGRGGNDVILGQGGNDRMSGNGGRDRLRGGGGADIVVGGAGRDTVGGSRGNDAVRGSGGPDVVLGNGGKDRVSGGAGNDRVSGGGGNDRVSGDRGNDRLDGGRGFDRCNGGPGRDDEQGCER